MVEEPVDLDLLGDRVRDRNVDKRPLAYADQRPRRNKRVALLAEREDPVLERLLRMPRSLANHQAQCQHAFV